MSFLLKNKTVKSRWTKVCILILIQMRGMFSFSAQKWYKNCAIACWTTTCTINRNRWTKV